MGNDIDELYYYRVVNGCYMIFLSSEELCVGDYVISDEQMEWLKGVLDEAKAADTPIFVINHHPIYLSETEITESLHGCFRNMTICFTFTAIITTS